MDDWLALTGTRRAGGEAPPIVAGLLTLVLLCAPPVQAASFHCAKARTAVEKMICADTELSELDEVLGAAYSRALERAADPKATGGVAPKGVESAAERSSDGLLPKYAVIESKEALICDPLVESLNTMPPRDRPVRVERPLGNDFIIDPWEQREYQMSDRAGNLNIRSWEAAFVDIDNDGKEDAVFRLGTWIHGRDYHETFVVYSAAPELISTDPMPEERARSIMTDERRRLLGNFIPNIHYAELVSLHGENFLMAGYFDFWADEQPGRWWVQLLRIVGHDVERVCFFKER